MHVEVYVAVVAVVAVVVGRMTESGDTGTAERNGEDMALFIMISPLWVFPLSLDVCGLHLGWWGNVLAMAQCNVGHHVWYRCTWPEGLVFAYR